MIKQKLKPQAIILELKLNSIKDLDKFEKELKIPCLKSAIICDWGRWIKIRQVI